MKIIEILNKNLKSEELIELFEDYDFEVIYEYDRLHEGMADSYRGKIVEMGLEFLFDENQTLKTIFIFTQKTEDYFPANLAELNIQTFSSRKSAIDFARKNNINYTEGSGNFLGQKLDWVKFMVAQYSIHYQYSNDILNQVTLQVEDAQ